MDKKLDQPSLPVWGRRISVRREGDLLLVSGEGCWLVDPSYPRLAAGDELLDQYARFADVWVGKKRGDAPPHIQFVNATTEDGLIEFVRRHGPVSARKFKVGEGKDWLKIKVEATQSVASLINEHLIFREAVKLIAELQKGKGFEPVVASAAVGRIMEAKGRQDREFKWSHSPHVIYPAPYKEYLSATLGALLRIMGKSLTPLFFHRFVCDLLNEYPPLLSPMGGRAVEFPPHEPAGVLPALYFMLRSDYLGGRGMRKCARADCGLFFSAVRRGQTFCSPYCSQLQRQRDYWNARGKKLRRAKGKKADKVKPVTKGRGKNS